MAKRILKSIYSFFEDLGRARAAGVLAQQGRHEEAKRLMISK